MEALLRAVGRAEEPTAVAEAMTTAAAAAPAASAPAAEGAGGGAADGCSGFPTRLVGQLDWLAVDGGGDTVLARMQKHVNTAFLSMVPRLETKYEVKGHAPLPKEMSEHEKINALARSAPCLPRAQRPRAHAPNLVERGQARARPVGGTTERWRCRGGD